MLPVKSIAFVARPLGILTPPGELLELLELVDDAEELLKFVADPLELLDDDPPIITSAC